MSNKKQEPISESFIQIYNVFLFIIAPVTLVIIWQISSNTGLLNKNILPSPKREVETLISLLASGKLQGHLLVSFIRVIKGFLIGTFLGLSLGTCMGLSKTVQKIFTTLVGVFRPIPMIAWIPLLILWMGITETSKVAVISIGSFWPVLLNTIQGIHSVDKKFLEVASTLEKKYVIFSIVLPSALPSVFTGIRLGISSAWTSVVAAEMIAASKGIGYMITYARELSQPHIMLVGVFTIGFVGLIIDAVIQYLQKKIIYW